MQAIEKLQTTVVTFKSSTFNTSETRPYFINPGCYGDDVAEWFIENLRGKGFQADDPGQEDFGWYFNFYVSGVKHCLVIGYRQGDKYGDGDWICWLERSRGLLGSLLGGRKRGIQPAAARTIHAILHGSRQVANVRWHSAHEFDRGREDLGKVEPSTVE